MNNANGAEVRLSKSRLTDELCFIQEISDLFISGTSINKIVGRYSISKAAITSYLNEGLSLGFMKCLSPREKKRIVNWRLRSGDSIPDMVGSLGISEGELRDVISQISIPATRPATKLSPPNKEILSILQREQKQAQEWWKKHKNEIKDAKEAEQLPGPRLRGRRIPMVSIDSPMKGGTIGDFCQFAPARSTWDQESAENLEEEIGFLRNSLASIHSLKTGLKYAEDPDIRRRLRNEMREEAAWARGSWAYISAFQQNSEYYERRREAWLTKTESIVLGFLRSGLTQTQIKDKMQISKQAVSKHVSKIRFKMGPYVDGLFVESGFGFRSKESDISLENEGDGSEVRESA